MVHGTSETFACGFFFFFASIGPLLGPATLMCGVVVWHVDVTTWGMRGVSQLGGVA